MSHNSAASYTSSIFGEEEYTVTTVTGTVIEDQDGLDYYREKLREDLIALKPSANIQVSKLNDEQMERFESVITTIRELRDNDPEFPQLQNEVKKVFGSGEAVKGTVKAFFIGCFLSNPKGVIGCSPSCLQNSASKSCHDRVLVFSNGRLIKQNEKISDNAYIFIEGTTFNGFNRQNINELKSANVKRVTLINQNSSEDSEIYDINDLPVVDGNGLNAVNGQNGNGTNNMGVNGAGLPPMPGANGTGLPPNNIIPPNTPGVVPGFTPGVNGNVTPGAPLPPLGSTSSSGSMWWLWLLIIFVIIVGIIIFVTIIGRGFTAPTTNLVV